MARLNLLPEIADFYIFTKFYNISLKVRFTFYKALNIVVGLMTIFILPECYMYLISMLHISRTQKRLWLNTIEIPSAKYKNVKCRCYSRVWKRQESSRDIDNGDYKKREEKE